MQDKHALVAYERADGRYDVHRSSTLGSHLELAARLTPGEPYSHEPDGTEPNIVSVDPLERGLTRQDIVDRLDFSRFGAVVLVSTTFEITPYRAVWFVLSHCCETVYDSDAFGYGALVEANHIEGESIDDDVFCARHEATEQTLGRLVDDGVLQARDARNRLRNRVIAYGRDGRDVRFATGQRPDAEASTLCELASTGRRLLGCR